MSEEDQKLTVLSADDFLPMSLFLGDYPIHIDLVYAQLNHPDNHFGDLYHASAKELWVHQDLVPIILLTSLLYKQFCGGWDLKLNDGLRPVEAQNKMKEKNFREELVSAPGTGAHPRGMAIDAQPIYFNPSSGKYENVDMGTRFDTFPDLLKDNSSARDYVDFGKGVAMTLDYCTRRGKLETVFKLAARMLSNRIIPLPDEYWDYRFQKEPPAPVDRTDYETYWGDYAAVFEKDLPAYMRLVGKPGKAPAKVVEQWMRKANIIRGIVEPIAAAAGVNRLSFKDGAVSEPAPRQVDYKSRLRATPQTFRR